MTHQEKAMEIILFTYDKTMSAKNGQFTVTLTPFTATGSRREPSRPRTFFVKDLETAASRVPDKALFRTALESEMAFRKTEGRFVSAHQEYTHLRVNSGILFRFVTECMKRKCLVLSDGKPAAFRIVHGTLPEITLDGNRFIVSLGGRTLAEYDVIVKTMPITVIRRNDIVQLKPGIPFSFLSRIPTGRDVSPAERKQLIDEFTQCPDQIKIGNTGVLERKSLHHALIKPRLDFEDTLKRARLSFFYDTVEIRDTDSRSLVYDVAQGVEIHRDAAGEARFKERLLSLGFIVRPEDDFSWFLPSRSLESIHAALTGEGFSVTCRRAPLHAPVRVKWNIRGGAAHILVGGTVVSGDMEMSMTGLLQAFHEKKSYVKRPDGSLGLIAENLRGILAGLSETGTLKGDMITFNRSDIASVYNRFDTLADVDTDAGYDNLRAFGKTVDGIRRHPLPPGLSEVLRPYQILGYNWLRTLRDLDLNGILADDMGLGKTLQVLALIAALNDEGVLTHPVLLIVPRTLIFNWELELKKFTPDLTCCVFAGAVRSRDPEFLKRHTLVITSYGLLRTEAPLLCGIIWEYVILDEANAIKNPNTQIAKAVKHIPARFRLSITGTPVENSPTDLWSQFDFLMPGFLKGLKSFKLTYGTDEKDLNRLRERTRPFILRRLKSQVLKELPPKTDVTIFCEFTDDQKAVYEKALSTAREEMAEMTGSRSFEMLRLILRLRQIACHPMLAIRHSRRAYGSGKLDEVFYTAMEILSEGHKILIFSQFTRHLKLVESLFFREKIPAFYLDGKTVNREKVVRDFKAHPGPCPFLISLKTGGTGLNLSEATYVFLLDPWWNPAVENQAIDRSHRLGQHQPVTVYRFITRGSIEEKVNDLKQMKRQIEEAVIDESVPQYVPYDTETLKALILSDGS
jgi:superfamily II DNA or RNA helicase